MAVTINNAEIRNLQVGPTIITDGLVSWWNVASTNSYPRTGSVLYDLVKKNQNNGSMINMSATNFTDDGGGALVFDGADEYMSVADDTSLDFDTSSFAVSLWAKFDSTLSTIDSYLIGKRGSSSGSSSGWQIKVQKETSTQWAIVDTGIANGTSSEFVSDFSTLFDLNRWYMITMTYNNSGLIRIYINTTGLTGLIMSGPFGSISNSVPVELCGTKYLNHSYQPWISKLLSGFIATVALYNRDLTTEEIYQQYVNTKNRFV